MLGRASAALSKQVGKLYSDDRGIASATDWTTFRRSWNEQTSIEKITKAQSCVASINPNMINQIKGGHNLRLRAYTFLHTTCFKIFISACIFTTMLLTWMETDLRASGADTPAWMTTANIALFVIYTLEIILRILLEQLYFFHSAWNNADVFFVFSDMFVLGLKIVEPDNDAWTWLRLARVVRIVRVARVLRFMIAFRELYMIVHGMLSISRALFWASGLMFLVLSMCSIVAVEVLHPLMNELVESGAFEECLRCSNSFDSVWNSNLLWIQSMVAGDGWGQTALPIIDKHPWSASIFLAVLIICQLGLLNLILTVMLDTAMESRADDDAHLLLEKDSQLKKAFEYLAGICADLDIDDSGELSLHEILEGYKYNAEFKSTLKLMDIGADDLTTVFQMMDQDDSGAVSYQEFVDQVHKMKTSDSHTLLVFIKHYVQKVERQLTSFMKTVHLQHDEDLREVKDGQRKTTSLLCGLITDITGQPAADFEPLVEIELEGETPTPVSEQKLGYKEPVCTESSDDVKVSDLEPTLQKTLERHKNEVLELLQQMQPRDTSREHANSQQEDKENMKRSSRASVEQSSKTITKAISRSSFQQSDKGLAKESSRSSLQDKGLAKETSRSSITNKKAEIEAGDSGESSKQDKAQESAVSSAAIDAVNKFMNELDTAGREIDNDLGDVFSSHVLTSLDSVSEEISAKIESLRLQVRFELVQALEDAASKLNKDTPSSRSRERQKAMSTSPLGTERLAGQVGEGNASDHVKDTQCMAFLCEPQWLRRQPIIEGLS